MLMKVGREPILLPQTYNPGFSMATSAWLTGEHIFFRLLGGARPSGS